MTVVVHPVVCIVCHGDNVIYTVNNEGKMLCRCTTCGIRFWKF